MLEYERDEEQGISIGSCRWAKSGANLLQLQWMFGDGCSSHRYSQAMEHF